MTTSPRRLARTAVPAVAATVVLGLTFTAGLAIGRDGAGDRNRVSSRTPAGETPNGQSPTDQATPDLSESIEFVNADLSATASCENLLATYIDRGLEQVTPWGWGGGVVYDAMGNEAADAAVPTEGGARSQVSSQSSSETGTNVQEVGVDEPDLVKTDGTRLFRVADGDLLTYDVTGAEPELLGTLALDGIDGPEILLAGDTVVVVGTDSRPERDPDSTSEPDNTTSDTSRYAGWAATPRTRVLTVDVTTFSAPRVTADRSITADLLGARQHGDTVRLTLTSSLPALDFVAPHLLRGERSALERNREVVRASTLADWLPQIETLNTDSPDSTDADSTDTSDDTTEPLLDCADVAIPQDPAGLGTLSVVGFDAADPAGALEDLDTTAIATSSTIAYSSTDRLVVATSPWDFGCWECEPMPGGGDQGSTRLYSFALDGTSTTYVASGSVEGSVADRWAMDSAGGVLRVAVGATPQTGNFNSVVTLREEGSDLVEYGRVDKLGIDEEIKSVRWFDDLAIVVTFRQTDPLYAIDLTRPGAPRLLGELKIPGFSEYLHPLNGNKLIGIGQDADASTGAARGAQAALFNVRDLTDPRRMSLVTYAKNTQALAGTDPRQFTWLPERKTALTVIAKGWNGRTGWVSVLSLAHGKISSRMIEVEYGDDVYAVRTVPLPDGRVLLVTGEDARFLAL